MTGLAIAVALVIVAVSEIAVVLETAPGWVIAADPRRSTTAQAEIA